MLDKVLKYQEVDAKLKAIERELQASDERKKANGARKQLDAIKDILERLEAKSGDILNSYSYFSEQFNELAETKKEFEGIAESCADEDEIEYVKKKAVELCDKLKTLETKLRRLSDETEQIMSEFKKFKANYIEQRKVYVENKDKYKTLKDSRGDEIAAIEKELADMEKDIDPNLLAKYKQKRQDNIFPILFLYNGEHCPNCNTELSKLDENNLKKNGAIECENCRRVIYYKANS